MKRGLGHGSTIAALLCIAGAERDVGGPPDDEMTDTPNIGGPADDKMTGTSQGTCDDVAMELLAGSSDDNPVAATSTSCDAGGCPVVVCDFRAQPPAVTQCFQHIECDMGHTAGDFGMYRTRTRQHRTRSDTTPTVTGFYHSVL